MLLHYLALSLPFMGRKVLTAVPPLHRTEYFALLLSLFFLFLEAPVRIITLLLRRCLGTGVRGIPNVVQRNLLSDFATIDQRTCSTASPLRPQFETDRNEVLYLTR